MTPELSLDAKLAALARSQAGAFSIAQARSLGFQEHHIRYRADSERWMKQLPRTFTLQGSPDSPTQRMLLAALWGGERAVLCRWTAAWALRLSRASRTVDVSLPVRRQAPADWIRVHRSNLEACDVEQIAGVEITNATRTLIDLAKELEAVPLEIMMDEALRCGRTSIPRLRWRLERIAHGHAGCRLLKRLVEERLPGGPSESVLETLMSRILRQMKKRGFPLPQRQFEVRLDRRTTARLDFAFPEFKVGLEGDGRRWHGPAQWQDDLRRENAFRQAGWDVRRFTWADATRNPSYILDQAEAALRLAGWRRPHQDALV